MNIVMFTNTYKPFVGGVERSVEMFTTEYRLKGHRTVIVTPEYEGAPSREFDVVRIPALQNFNGSDFSVKLPAPGVLSKFLEEFRPDLVHSHHPFLIGDTALRVASSHRIPLVYTFHTLYEQYTHYVPGDSGPLKRFVMALTTGYANLCDFVFAPSNSAATMMRSRGVQAPLAVIPTGIYPERYGRKGLPDLRKKLGIPPRATVVGLVSRIAPEKNIDFLARTVAGFVAEDDNRYFLVVGSGPALPTVHEICAQYHVGSRLVCTGTLEGDLLAGAFRAMDVFAFASHSETQGIVLAEAMASEVPVVAVDAPGVREIVLDGENGRLIGSDDGPRFSEALAWAVGLSLTDRWRVKRNARRTAQNFGIDESVTRALSVYDQLLQRNGERVARDTSMWEDALQRIKIEWELVVNMTRATSAAFRKPPSVVQQDLG